MLILFSDGGILKMYQASTQQNTGGQKYDDYKRKQMDRQS